MVFYVYVICNLDALWQGESVCFELDSGLRGILFTYEIKSVLHTKNFRKNKSVKSVISFQLKQLVLPTLTRILMTGCKMESYFILFLFVYHTSDFSASFWLHCSDYMLIFWG